MTDKIEIEKKDEVAVKGEGTTAISDDTTNITTESKKETKAPEKAKKAKKAKKA